MSPQLDYEEMVASVKGGLADVGNTDIVSMVSAVDINFGLGLRILSTGLAALPTAVDQDFAGIAVQVQKDIPRATGVALYEADEAISVIKKGRVWVYAEQAVNPSLAVFWRHTVNAALNPGDFRVDVDGVNATDISSVARWVSVTTVAGLAELEINLP